MIDFRGSFDIQFDAIVKCVRNNKKTVTKVNVDGEGVKHSEFCELIEEVERFEELQIFFGEGI